MSLRHGMFATALTLAASLFGMVSEARAFCCWGGHRQAYNRQYAPACPAPACPAPACPSQIIAASAIIEVHLPAGAKLTAEGQTITGTGAVRYVSTKAIPMGAELEVTLKVDGLPAAKKEMPGKEKKDDKDGKKDDKDGKKDTGSETRKIKVKANEFRHEHFGGAGGAAGAGGGY